jgi:hypothetical protein
LPAKVITGAARAIFGAEEVGAEVAGVEEAGAEEVGAEVVAVEEVLTDVGVEEAVLDEVGVVLLQPAKRAALSKHVAKMPMVFFIISPFLAC